MRSNVTELQPIRAILGGVNPRGSIYLFSSGANHRRCGGDVDFFLGATQPIDLNTAVLLQYHLSTACETTVDLLVKSLQDDDRPIHQIARQGVRL